MIEWIKSNKLGVIRGMFLVPIILVMIISISHVISWYDLANPTSWAIYLSIAIEIAAMSAISAASVRIRGFSVWFVFILVTFIQFIGNIYFCYSDIDVTTKNFKDWSDLEQRVRGIGDRNSVKLSAAGLVVNGQPKNPSMTADKPAKPAKTSAESTKPPQQKN